MCNVCKDPQCHWGEYCYPTGVSTRPEFDMDDWDWDGGEVCCASCKKPLKSAEAAIAHQCQIYSEPEPGLPRSAQFR